jgi:ribosomal-protein-alanine N-acetyltransferase
MGNAAAQQLYRNFGFVSSGTRPNYYPETGEDALVMWLYNLLSPQVQERLGTLGKGL